jgi:hypothetical protein
MKLIKKFESYTSREEMCQLLCKNGYEMNELEKCSNEELAEMCSGIEKEMSNESNSLKENCGDTNNYMFFGNLKTIKRLVDEMLEMDEAKVDAMLSNGHNWAVDHIATSKDDVEEVFNFLAGHDDSVDHGFNTHDDFGHDSEEEHTSEEEPINMNKDDEGGIKSFQNFK